MSAADRPMPLAYAERRRRFYERLGNHAVAVVPGAVETFRNGDNRFPFRQSSDLLYLTGFSEPHAAAVFAPGAMQPFTLFVQPPRDWLQEIYFGRRTGPEGATERYHADRAFPIEPIDQMEQRLYEIFNGREEVVFPIGCSGQWGERVLRLIDRLRGDERRGGRAPVRITDLRTVLHEMRLYKEPDEVAALRRCVAITADAHRATMKMMRAGVREMDVRIHIDACFHRAGGAPGYSTIAAVGRNAGNLHHHGDETALEEGQLLLLDAGCELDGYTADVTRTYPVLSRHGTRGAPFSPPQREIYDLVLKAQREGLRLARPGETLERIHERCTEILVEGAVELGLLTGAPQELIASDGHRRLYPHKTSHWLGLDVHDVGAYFPYPGMPRVLAPGMVLTIEPGLYIPDDEGYHAPYRGLAVRIEDDILITDSAEGHEVLTDSIPKLPEDLLDWIS